ncbi:hypothetical protein J8273_2029 [Carpediemonas membranifera]|uniref:Uncharacterized protein n=1 Tax=Carpediemonas membranifera TaxID=201153 RepID=A0A8J6AX25_9EUKA|nr:hypothetical protein J8273_2029 [Carpediemonas membranifera]|eukprot:KAG9396298.1 hypothetical protein J8273_2029 [Carpediemonas membranifera]
MATRAKPGTMDMCSVVSPVNCRRNRYFSFSRTRTVFSASIDRICNFARNFTLNGLLSPHISRFQLLQTRLLGLRVVHHKLSPAGHQRVPNSAISSQQTAPISPTPRTKSTYRPHDPESIRAVLRSRHVPRPFPSPVALEVVTAMLSQQWAEEGMVWD